MLCLSQHPPSCTHSRTRPSTPGNPAWETCEHKYGHSSLWTSTPPGHYSMDRWETESHRGTETEERTGTDREGRQRQTRSNRHMREETDGQTQQGDSRMSKGQAGTHVCLSTPFTHVCQSSSPPLPCTHPYTPHSQAHTHNHTSHIHSYKHTLPHSYTLTLIGTHS